MWGWDEHMRGAGWAFGRSASWSSQRCLVADHGGTVKWWPTVEESRAGTQTRYAGDRIDRETYLRMLEDYPEGVDAMSSTCLSVGGTLMLCACLGGARKSLRGAPPTSVPSNSRPNAAAVQNDSGSTPPVSDAPMKGGMGGGMMGGGCPMCRRFMGQETGQEIPQSLPKPQSAEWVGGMRELLGLERLSRNQYEQDAGQYSAQMPYGMIIPQEKDHIAWIEKLFAAYGLKPGTQVPPVKKTTSLKEAYTVCLGLEADLIPRYERAIEGASDPTGRQVLENILFQTRMHHAMFQHALSMTEMGMRMGR
jgi:hypothetical protein